MLGDISKADHIYIAVDYTDMRKQIDGLAAVVQQNFRLDIKVKIRLPKLLQISGYTLH